MRSDLPSGTVTFLFTDVEGSTRLLHSLGAEGYAAALAEHRRLIREACSAEGGVEVDTQGDAFFFAFPTAPGALAAASAFTESLASGQVQVRVGLHTGTPLLTDEGYVGGDVHRAARVAASAHGGQVVLSAATVAEIGVSNSLLQALSELGEHRLKDIEGAVPLFQLGAESFPPLKTISNTNLPRPASSFLGREAELGEVLARIEHGARLVTLTGPGGTGKTRLALEAATSLVGEYKAGVFWVGLASLRDPSLVTEQLAQVLGAKDSLAAHIAERELLLLLDNLEQVIECATELSQLLSACPNLTLLVTSRELLRISGETEYPVPPLVSSEAVELFCARAQLEPTEEIAELCARLDSLPLAVELAAARAKALTPAQILERLSQRLDLLKGGRDADPRQQTLRATIEWSYDLLTPGEQQLFACLSVFTGGCTLEAAEEVADADLDTLQSLVEKSLLRFSDERYWMLETIREYAAEGLGKSEYDELVQRIAGYVVSLAKAEGGPAFLGRQGTAFSRLAAEHANVRAVAASAVHEGRPEPLLELTAAMWVFWCARHAAEALEWVTWATAERRGVKDDVWFPAVLGASEVAKFAGDVDRAVELKTAFLAKVGEYENAEPWWEAGVLADLADIALARGDLDEAVGFAERSWEIRETKGLSSARALVTLGDIAMRTGDLDRAEQLLDEAAAQYRDSGHEENLVSTIGSLAGVARRRRELGRAEELLREGLRRVVALDDRSIAAGLLRELAVVADERGFDERAGILWGAADAVFEAEGIRRGHDFDEEVPTVSDEALEVGARLSFDEAVAYALASID